MIIWKGGKVCNTHNAIWILEARYLCTRILVTNGSKMSIIVFVHMCVNWEKLNPNNSCSFKYTMRIKFWYQACFIVQNVWPWQELNLHRTRRDSNPQCSDPKSDALSIMQRAALPLSYMAGSSLAKEEIVSVAKLRLALKHSYQRAGLQWTLIAPHWCWAKSKSQISFWIRWPHSKSHDPSFVRLYILNREHVRSIGPSKNFLIQK